MKRELFYKVILHLCRVSIRLYFIELVFYKQVETNIHRGIGFNVLRATLMMVKAVWNNMLCWGFISRHLQEQAG
jgi:hypothetical protein